jgi:hypothetical protein
MALREVLITISNETVPSLTYLAKSYPDPDYDDNGLREIYKVPVYYVYIDGVNNDDIQERKTWNALRFMPYWNPEGKYGYKNRGWINAGIHCLPKRKVREYKPNYTIHNSPSVHKGAIVIRDSFYIHEGPGDISYAMAGSAGCVEIIGSFLKFKEDIRDLSGNTSDADSAMLELVKAGKLYLEVQSATPPDIFKNIYGEEKAK